jgi:large subunit ribosomal protein LP2
MRYVAAYLLAVIGGNKSPSVDNIKKILGSVGIETDNEKAEKVVKELTGKDIAEVIAKGSEKLASVPSGGGAAVAAAPAAGGAAAPAGGSPAKEDKKAKKEESDEEDDDMGFGLFD